MQSQRGVTALRSSRNKIVRESRNGVVRVWGYDASEGRGATPRAAGGTTQGGSGNGGFKLLRTLHSHMGEVTGLVIVTSGNFSMLWSSSVNAVMWLRDMSSGECKHLVTWDTLGGAQAATAGGSISHGIGHAWAVTVLLTFKSPAAAGMELCVQLTA